MYSVYCETITLETLGEGDILNLSSYLSDIIKRSGVKTGIINLFSEGSTAALTTIEFEEGVLDDFKSALSKIAPEDLYYSHDRAWGDGNGRSHVKAAFIGPSLTIPVRNSMPLLGVWQQPVLVEFDVKEERKRRIHCTVTGISEKDKI